MDGTKQDFGHGQSAGLVLLILGMLASYQKIIDYTSFDLARHAMEFGDITMMRFPDNSVDYFICFHVLEHIPDEHLALAEVRRALKPWGPQFSRVGMSPEPIFRANRLVP